MARRALAAIAAALIAGSAIPGAALGAKAPDTWDDLVAVKAKRLDLVYLLPGADFRPYTKVMLDPPEVTFRKNWLRDYNSQTRMDRLSEADVEKAIRKAGSGFEEIFTKAYTEAGFQVVQSPGPDVLRVRTGVINIAVTAPDVMTAGRSRSFAQEAGEATLVIEARDSESGAVLGRAVDRRLAGDTSTLLRNSVTNRADFERLFRDWAKASVAGLNELKSLSPIEPEAIGRK